MAVPSLPHYTHFYHDYFLSSKQMNRPALPRTQDVCRGPCSDARSACSQGQGARGTRNEISANGSQARVPCDQTA